MLCVQRYLSTLYVNLSPRVGIPALNGGDQILTERVGLLGSKQVLLREEIGQQRHARIVELCDAELVAEPLKAVLTQPLEPAHTQVRTFNVVSFRSKVVVQDLYEGAPERLHVGVSQELLRKLLEGPPLECVEVCVSLVFNHVIDFAFYERVPNALADEGHVHTNLLAGVCANPLGDVLNIRRFIKLGRIEADLAQALRAEYLVELLFHVPLCRAKRPTNGCWSEDGLNQRPRSLRLCAVACFLRDVLLPEILHDAPCGVLQHLCLDLFAHVLLQRLPVPALALPYALHEPRQHLAPDLFLGFLYLLGVLRILGVRHVLRTCGLAQHALAVHRSNS